MVKNFKNCKINKPRRRKTISVLFFVVLISLWIFTGSRDKDPRELDTKKAHGTAIVITGAAAKIAQEAALLEHLYNNGMLKDVVFISGASSGALNAAVLNAILSGKMSWLEYKEILCRINNDDIFLRNGKKLPVNTDPLRTLITRILHDSIGYKKLYDLPIPTAFSIVNLKTLVPKERTYRLSNVKINSESDPSLNIVDVLMASTSYPFAFPAVKISEVNTIPDIKYHDGGIANDHVPYQAVVDFENYRGIKVEKMIIISRKRDTIPNLNIELQHFGIDRFKFFDKLGVSPEAISNKGFYKRLKEIQKESPDLAERTYVYVPDFKDDFLMFDFSTLKKQYEVTEQWAKTHSPIPLTEYLKNKN